MFGKKKKDKKNKKSTKKMIDKVVMGAVIGGAIGSVVGASMAPKKGKETRNDIKKASKSIFYKIKSLVLRKRQNNVKKIPHEDV